MLQLGACSWSQTMPLPIECAMHSVPASVSDCLRYVTANISPVTNKSARKRPRAHAEALADAVRNLGFQ